MRKILIRAAVAAPLCLLLAACSSVSLWPFGGDDQLQSTVPADATTYNCVGGKQIYVRSLDNGAAAWVILPNRSLRLDKLAGSATSYGNGADKLVVKGKQATFTDGSDVSYTGCKSAAK